MATPGRVRGFTAIGIGALAWTAVVTCNHEFTTPAEGTGGQGQGGAPPQSECTEDTDCPAAGACIDAHCLGGECIFQMRSCDDGNPCTFATCDPGLDECVSITANDGVACASNAVCRVGACECLEGYDSCDSEPGCEARLASDSDHCGQCDMSCSAGEACLEGDCGACSDHAQCDDGLDCTTDLCDGGECVHSLEDDFCLIAGECYATSVANPANDCEVCSPSRSSSQWTVNEGGECSHSQCGQGAGVCKSGEDGTVECALAPGHCYIEGDCYEDGDIHPDDERCDICDSQENQFRWTCRTDGDILPDCCIPLVAR